MPPELMPPGHAFGRGEVTPAPEAGSPVAGP
jgi:hypothetical protein